MARETGTDEATNGFKSASVLQGVMLVATVPDRRVLGEELAQELDAGMVAIETRRFPDGERYARVPESIAADAVVLADLRPDERVLEALIACDAARQAGAQQVLLAVPYLAYARQDRAFEQGEAISARALTRTLAANADAFATVDPHTEAVLEHFEGPTAAATAAPEIAQALESEDIDVVLAPDEGARERARDVAEALGCPFDHLEKRRRSAHEVEIAPHGEDVTGQTLALVDDIIATGGTMATATRQLLEAGAARVLLAATHGIFADGALKRLQDAGADVILATDAIDSPVSKISVAPALARAVRQARSG